MDESIEKYRHDAEIIRLTAEQISKDFGSLLPEVIIPENAEMVFEEIKNQVLTVLQSLHQNNKSALRSLFYRVDLKESEIAAISASALPGLAEKIIRREFQKVLTKKYFSS